MWILDNGHKIKFWYDSWLEISPLIKHIDPALSHLIDHNAEISECIPP